MAVAMREPRGPACLEVIQREEDRLISAGTVSEILVVAAGRRILPRVLALLDNLGLQIVPLTAIDARRVGAVYDRWGKGLHPAGLNFGDCFAYELAQRYACPLLYVGDDFGKTDVVSAL